MNSALPFLSFWGHAAVGFLYAALAIWTVHRFGWINRQQIVMVAAMVFTSIWGILAVFSGPFSPGSLLTETLRNLAWLSFLFFLLRSGEGRQQPQTINMIYIVLALVLLMQPVADYLAVYLPANQVSNAIAIQSALMMRMLFAIGALVLVHNLYTISAPEARWGIALPMAALAALWMFDLNLYTIAYITRNVPAELVGTRGFTTAILAPVFVMASQRNSDWGLRLSRSVAFQSVSLLAIGSYLAIMVFIATMLQLFGGTYARLAQISLIFGMSIIALIVMPSGKFRAWLNVMIAKNFFRHRYDYRNEWMRFADTIGYPSQEAAPFHERVIKSLGDIFDSPAGMLLVPDDQNRLTLQSRWNWPTAEVPVNCATSQMLPFFESTGHILSMDEVRAGTDDRCDPRAVPQWLFDEARAWAVIPLVHFGKLTGIAVLARPRLHRVLDWEDLDMIRVVSRQLASYLAEASSQKALADAQQFEQFNRRFAFVVHDIKNLVSQLSILSRNAAKHADNPEFQADMVETLQSSVAKLNELLARLSQHNKSKHNALVATDISAAVLKTVHAKRLIYPLESDLAENLTALADPARIETIINHLLQNAIEATSDGSSIKVSCRKQGSDIAIKVTDNGSGMSDAFVANQLFKPFESTKQDGFGIGAYEARALAVSMGGQLRVESRLGKGSTFTLVLPASSDRHIEAEKDNEDMEKAA
jgi:putative PEP-CTERM system histidine kinase